LTDRSNLKKLLAKRLENPHVPGGELHGDLKGCYKIKLNKQGIRLVYSVEDDKLIVMVMSVDKREDSIVYKSAVTRMTEKAATLAKITKDQAL
jgi:mRNA interferase RelE/StbE